MSSRTRTLLGTAIVAMASAVIGAAVTGAVFLGGLLPAASDPAGTLPAATSTPPAITVTPGIPVEGNPPDYETTVMRVAEVAGPSIVGIYVEIPSGVLFAETGSGSGIVMSGDGYILTNNHVVCDSAGNYVNGTKLTVYRTDGQETYPARLVGRDAQTDLAVLKIEKTGLPVVQFGDSDAVRVGQLTVAIGNPAGLEFMGSVTSGVISGLDREVVLESGVAMQLIQTDAAINPGNSGGALLDSSGRVIGINNAGLAKDEYEGVNFAIPSNLAIRIFEDLKTGTGQQARPYLGVTILQDAEYANVRDQYGLPESGVYVARVADRGPAKEAGVEVGDVITAWNGQPIDNLAALTGAIDGHKPGDQVVVTLFRSEGGYRDLDITLGERFD